MGHPDPIRIKAYVDDLARLGVRHGLRLRQFDGYTMIEPAPSGFRGYCAPMGDEEACLTIEVLGPPTSVAELEWLEIARTRPAFVQSVDPTRMSAHERMSLRASAPGDEDTEAVRASILELTASLRRLGALTAEAADEIEASMRHEGRRQRLVALLERWAAEEGDGGDRGGPRRCVIRRT